MNVGRIKQKGELTHEISSPVDQIFNNYEIWNSTARVGKNKMFLHSFDGNSIYQVSRLGSLTNILSVLHEILKEKTAKSEQYDLFICFKTQHFYQITDRETQSCSGDSNITNNYHASSGIGLLLTEKVQDCNIGKHLAQKQLKEDGPDFNDPEAQNIESRLKFVSMKCKNQMKTPLISCVTVKCKQSRSSPVILQSLNDCCIDTHMKKKKNSTTAGCLW